MYKTRLESIYANKTVSPLQKKAWEKLWKVGMPDRRHESVRQLRLKPLWESSFTEGRGTLTVEKDPKVIVSPLKEAFVTYHSFLHNRLSKRLEEENDFFALVTESLEEGGLFVYVPPKTQAVMPLSLLQTYQEVGKQYASKIQVVVGRESSLEIVYEMGPCASECVVHEMFDLSLERGAKCRFVDFGFVPESMVAFRSLRAVLKEESRLEVVSSTRGSRLYRFDYQVDLMGDNAECEIKGAWHVGGAESAHVLGEIKHMAPYTRSRQHFKGVVRDLGKSTFEGKIYVDSVAQKTEAYQLNNNLILDEGASAFTKPNLEVLADDVKASHGATMAELSPEELFYLRSRGLSAAYAKRALVNGYLDAIVKEHKKMREKLYV